MRRSAWRVSVLGAIVVAAGAGSFWLGTRSVDEAHARESGYRSGYFAGLQAGEAQGREEGRALQAGSEVSPAAREPVQAAFTDGYAAGANDAFGDFDGGWALARPYLVTVVSGSGPIVYRISARLPVQPGIEYYLCPDGRSICEAPRR